jgi:hypothetical protein
MCNPAFPIGGTLDIFCMSAHCKNYSLEQIFAFIAIPNIGFREETKLHIFTSIMNQQNFLLNKRISIIYTGITYAGLLAWIRQIYLFFSISD